MSLSSQHQLQQIATVNRPAALTLKNNNSGCQKNYFCFVCPSVCVPDEKAVNSPAAETSKDTLICLCAAVAEM